jgi:transcriptional regulator with XRE-family HTH domain
MKFYTSKDLANLCRELRKCKGLTQKQLGRQLRKSRGAVGNAENELSSNRDGTRLEIIEHLSGRRFRSVFVEEK